MQDENQFEEYSRRDLLRHYLQLLSFHRHSDASENLTTVVPSATPYISFYAGGLTEILLAADNLRHRTVSLVDHRRHLASGFQSRH